MYIKPELFAFFRELKQNNNRDWFQANKNRYEKHVKEPLLAFTAAFAERVPEVSPYIMAVPKVTGGSLFRIYRDLRFSKDKTPYKTGAGLHFRHERGKDVHAPGFYLHLEPGDVFAGCGIWHPDTATLTRIRTRIVEHPEQWQSAVGSPPFSTTMTLGGESLKRAPKGFEPDHPLIEDLKRKDFIGSAELSEDQVLRPDFLDLYLKICHAGAPLMEFLTRSLDLSW